MNVEDLRQEKNNPKRQNRVNKIEQTKPKHISEIASDVNDEN